VRGQKGNFAVEGKDLAEGNNDKDFWVIFKTLGGKMKLPLAGRRGKEVPKKNSISPKRWGVSWEKESPHQKERRRGKRNLLNMKNV